ncbi:MAG: hypothetical protein IIC78_09575 [Chloroflexi bacterium]|nr:hypothetical protein [Chloroflexota bacterium]
MIQSKTVAYAHVVKAAFQLTIYQNFTDSFVLFGILVQPIIIAVLGLWILGDKSSESEFSLSSGAE